MYGNLSTISVRDVIILVILSIYKDKFSKNVRFCAIYKGQQFGNNVFLSQLC